MVKGKNNFISLTLQKLIMNRDFPMWRCSVQKNKLTCIGRLQPTDFSSEYLIKIEYSVKEKPIISILSPVLKGPDVPHVYKGNHPCVYFPPNEEWNSRKYLSKTILPFLASWLYFYEVWLVTGIWEGGGIHIKKNS